MIKKTLSCLLIAATLSFCVPQPAEAVIPTIIRLLHHPTTQAVIESTIQDPSTPDTIADVWDWVTDTASDIVDSIEENLQDLSEVNPLCTVCAMTGVHICSGGCSN